MAATLSLSLQGSNYDTLSAEQQKGLAKPELSGDTWTLDTTRRYENLKVENYDRETVDIKKADFKSLDFRYDATSGGAARIASSELKKASFTSGTEASVESLVFRDGAKLSSTSAELRKGGDALKFKSGSESERGIFNLGEGTDTAVFGKGAKAVRADNGDKNIVDLGRDVDADLVNIKNSEGVSGGLRIENFGKEDVLKIGGQDYDYAQVIANKGKIDGVIINTQDV